MIDFHISKMEHEIQQKLFYRNKNYMEREDYNRTFKEVEILKHETYIVQMY